MHLNLKKEKTKLTYSIGNKINFLGFNLYRTPYNQFPYRNSRRVEKAKRIKTRLLADKDRVKKKLGKHLRLNLTKTLEQNLRIANSKSRKQFIYQLSETLVTVLGNKVNYRSSYREILREFEFKLADVILNDINQNLKELFSFLIKPEYLNSIKNIYNSNKNTSYTHKNVTLINKFKLSETEFARRFTNLLKENGFEHYKYKNINKIKFDQNIVKYMRNAGIKLIYYPIDFIINEELKNRLVKISNIRIKRGALATNYKLLINYFWNLQNKIVLELKTTKKQSQNLKYNLVSLENDASLIELPINVRMNWKPILDDLKMKGILNKKNRPSNVARIMSLGVSDIIKYFNSCGERSTMVISKKENVEISYVTKDSIHLLIGFFKRMIQKANNKLNWNSFQTCFKLDTIWEKSSNSLSSVKDFFSLKRFNEKEVRMYFTLPKKLNFRPVLNSRGEIQDKHLMLPRTTIPNSSNGVEKTTNWDLQIS